MVGVAYTILDIKKEVQVTTTQGLRGFHLYVSKTLNLCSGCDVKMFSKWIVISSIKGSVTYGCI
jgi:hypothetical protein